VSDAFNSFDDGVLPAARSKALFASFLSPPGQKGKRSAVRELPVLVFFWNYDQEIKPIKNHNPGVAPPDGAILFYWPKRVCRKGLRYAGHVWLARAATSIQDILTDQ
jgi:hypothetical protein